MMPCFWCNKAHDISLPDTLMLIALAVPAKVLMVALGPKTWPLISGKMYVSPAAKVRAFTIKFELAAEKVAVIKFTLSVAALAE